MRDPARFSGQANVNGVGVPAKIRTRFKQGDFGLALQTVRNAQA